MKILRVLYVAVVIAILAVLATLWHECDMRGGSLVRSLFFVECVARR